MNVSSLCNECMNLLVVYHMLESILTDLANFTVSFNAFLSMSFHVVGPRHAAAVLPDATDASGPNDSGDGVVEDELLSELTDNLGTTKGTKLCVLQIILFPFGFNRGS